MGANEKYDATYHGGQYTPATENVEHSYVAYRSSKVDLITGHHEFTRWLESVRAEAKAEALNEAAAEIDRLESIGDTARNQVSEDQEKDYWRFHGTPITDWLRDRANQYKEAPNA